MKHLSKEAKRSIVEKALTGKNKEWPDIASQHNIGYSSLQRWVSQYKRNTGEDKISNNHNASANSQITRSKQFQHLLSTATLDETALGAYCREHGLYSFQLQQWKNEFMSQTNQQKKQDQNSELKALRAENKRLKQDVRRKDRALAEATALLVLKKKVELIWGEREDD